MAMDLSLTHLSSLNMIKEFFIFLLIFIDIIFYFDIKLRIQSDSIKAISMGKGIIGLLNFDRHRL